MAETVFHALAARALWRRVAAWSALLAISLGAALPTLAQAFGSPRAAWSEMCSTRGGAAAARLSEPTSDAAVLAHLFQHCGDCLAAQGPADDAPALPTAALGAHTLAGRDAAPTAFPAAAPAADAPWPAPPARAPPASL